MGKQKGIALLIAISVTLILGLFLANNFERNRTNLKLLSNTESRFTLNTINFSVLKAISLAIKESGANYIYDFISILGSIPDFPINITQDPEINIYNPKIWSMQHYFFPNKPLNVEEAKLFNGILNQNLINANVLEEEQAIALNDKIFVDSIKQWRSNSDNSDFVSEFPVYRRNSYFDLDSEFYFFVVETLKSEGKIPKDNFKEELTFRLYSTAEKKANKAIQDLSSKTVCRLSPLNLNMLPKNSQSKADNIIREYLEWFDFHPKKSCKVIKNEEQKILDSINKKFYEEEDDLFLITNIGNNYFTEGLGELELTNDKKVYFTYRSNLVGIKYELENRKNRIQVEVHFYLEYKSNNRSSIPDTVYILYYKIS